MRKRQRKKNLKKIKLSLFRIALASMFCSRSIRIRASKIDKTEKRVLLAELYDSTKKLLKNT